MTYDKRFRTRRDFLKDIGRGAAGVGLGAAGLSRLAGRAGANSRMGGTYSLASEAPFTDPYLDPNPRSGLVRPGALSLDANGQLYRRAAPPARVSLVKGTNRRDMVFKSLKFIEDDVLAAIGDREIMIKPNVVTPINPLGSLHVDAVRGILDFLAPYHKKKIIVGEAATLDTRKGFENYGYLALEKDYNVQLVDLNRTGDFEYRYVINKDNQPIPIRILSAFLDRRRFMISAAPMKTRDALAQERHPRRAAQRLQDKRQGSDAHKRQHNG
jgi:hypothetical protein